MELCGVSEAKEEDRGGVDCRRIGGKIEHVWGKVIKPEMCWKVTHAHQHAEATFTPHHRLRLKQQCVSEPSAERRGKTTSCKMRKEETRMQER